MGVFDTQQGLRTGASAQIYNNTVYMGPGDNGDVTSGTVNSGTSISYSNNLIYKLGTGEYSTTRTTWTHNLFYGNHPASEPTDTAKVTSDPLLANPGGGTDGRSSASAYQLLTGSPALSAGALISGNGGTDFFGNSVSASTAPNIGAYNGAAVASTSGSGTYLRFDEGTGVSAHDTSGANNNATLQAGASWTTGTIGAGALSLTGAANSWADLPKPVVDTAGSYTVSAWVKPSSLTGNQTYISTDGSSISPFYLQLTGGRFALTERSSDSTHAAFVQVLGTAPTMGTWYQLLGTYDASAHQMALYVNGALQGTAAYSSGWTAAGHTTVGRAKWNGSNVDFVSGAIDDVRVMPRAVTAREAFAIGTGAAAYFPLDENAGGSFADVTGSVPMGHLESQTAWTSTSREGAAALSFNGTKGTFAVSPVSAIDTGKSFTVAAWVKLNSTTGNQTFLSMPVGNVSPFYLQLTGGKLAFVVQKLGLDELHRDAGGKFGDRDNRNLVPRRCRLRPGGGNYRSLRERYASGNGGVHIGVDGEGAGGDRGSRVCGGTGGLRQRHYRRRAPLRPSARRRHHRDPRDAVGRAVFGGSAPRAPARPPQSPTRPVRHRVHDHESDRGVLAVDLQCTGIPGR